MDQTSSRVTSRPKALHVLVGILLVVIATMAYFGHGRIDALHQELSSCREAACTSPQGLTARIAPPLVPGPSVNAAELEGELLRLKNGLRATEQDRDRLAEQVVACGAEGCQALAARLAKAEADVQAMKHQQRSLRQQVASLRADNRQIREQLAKEFSAQTGQRLLLMEIARLAPIDIGTSTPTDAQLSELQEALQPYKNTPLLVVGIADHRPYKGPSAELKQLGLMLSRAQIVKAMGYEVYYQVRQNDPGLAESRGIIVYQMSMQSSATSMSSEGSLAMAVPTYYTAQ